MPKLPCRCALYSFLIRYRRVCESCLAVKAKINFKFNGYYPLRWGRHWLNSNTNPTHKQNVFFSACRGASSASNGVFNCRNLKLFRNIKFKVFIYFLNLYWRILLCRIKMSVMQKMLIYKLIFKIDFLFLCLISFYFSFFAMFTSKCSNRRKILISKPLFRKTLKVWHWQGHF